MIIIYQVSVTTLTKDMATTCIKQGLSYSEYQIYAAEYYKRLLILISNGSLIVPIIPEDDYYELAIDMFIDIQSSVEEDSYIRQLDYTHMDNRQIIHYVFKYHFVI